ncbi:MAG: cyclic nucleotide-binding protein [Microvirga sp.]|jgi:CRP-like cAMP-binding protein|nr:cyclic nucleotide-binding protein [Microvirga sp.]
MASPLVRKLEHGAALSQDDRARLEEAARDVRGVGPRHDLIGEGDRPEEVHLILEGFACRYKMLPGGERQIMAFLVPGDFCDLHVAILGEMDHGIATISPCKVAYIPQRTIDELTSKHPAIARALWWATLVDEGTLREWIVNMGRRSADEQMAHLLCELLLRLESVGLAHENGFDFPVTQEELADTLGLSNVHVNRVLQQLRETGMITLTGRRLTIHDVDRLQEFAGFNPNYLHLVKRARPTRERAA